jgi:hypothetical protein
MANIFCTDCGAKHPYAGIKPKFCASCGASFQSEIMKVRPSSMNARHEEEGDEEYIHEVPVLKRLSVKIENEERVTLGGLAPLNPVELEYSEEASNYTKKTKQEILARSVQDCLPVNKSKSIDE